jgi:acetolactate synthase-1/2/3 large subunit
MGFSIPAAVGAKVGAPERDVLVVCGDGGFQMNMQELGTAAEQGLNLKIFVLNNHRLGMVRQLQEFYCDKRYTAVDLEFDLDFAGLAKFYGMEGYTVATEEEVAEILPKILASPAPAIVNCLIDPDENVLPMVLSGSAISEAID